MDYERITYREEGAKRSQTVYLENTKEGQFLGADTLVGIEVTKSGEKTFTENIHIIQLALIRKRTTMKMNLHYGHLEPVQ